MFDSLESSKKSRVFYLQISIGEYGWTLFWFFFNEKNYEIVEFYDDIRNSFGIYKVLRNFFESNGKYHYKKAKITEDNGEVKEISNKIHTTHFVDR